MGPPLTGGLLLVSPYNFKRVPSSKKGYHRTCSWAYPSGSSRLSEVDIMPLLSQFLAPIIDSRRPSDLKTSTPRSLKTSEANRLRQQGQRYAGSTVTSRFILWPVLTFHPYQHCSLSLGGRGEMLPNLGDALDLSARMLEVSWTHWPLTQHRTWGNQKVKRSALGK